MNYFDDPYRNLMILITGIMFISGSFIGTWALTPMSKKEMSSVTGQDGVDISFRVQFNNGGDESNDGTLLLGGGNLSVLHDPGGQGFLALGEFGSDFTWSKLRVDLVNTGSKPVISIEMNDSDDITGFLSVDRVGLTSTASVNGTSINPDIMGDFTIDGPIDVDGKIQAFPH
ncbi:MAG: hypothetical protein ABEK50_15520 [bacterium]